MAPPIAHGALTLLRERRLVKEVRADISCSFRAMPAARFEASSPARCSTWQASDAGAIQSDRVP